MRAKSGAQGAAVGMLEPGETVCVESSTTIITRAPDPEVGCGDGLKNSEPVVEWFGRSRCRARARGGGGLQAATLFVGPQGRTIAGT